MTPGDLVRVTTTYVYSSGDDLMNRVGIILDVEEPDGVLELEPQILVMIDSRHVWLYLSEITEVDVDDE